MVWGCWEQDFSLAVSLRRSFSLRGLGQDGQEEAKELAPLGPPGRLPRAVALLLVKKQT
jgi:hypothetical protein